MQLHLRRSLAAIRQSFRFLAHNPQLLFFPIALAAAIVLITFWFGLAAISTRNILFAENVGQLVGNTYLIGFYLSIYAVTVFTACAISACALYKFQSGNPTIFYGLSRALGRLVTIIFYTLIAATVGLILRLVPNRSRIGRMVAAKLGGGWPELACLAPAVIVGQYLGPIASPRASGILIKNMWAEGATRGTAIGRLTLVAAIIAGIPMMLGVRYATSGALGNGVLISSLLWLALIVVSTTINAVYSAALYHYATTATAPEGFDQTLLERAFTTR